MIGSRPLAYIGTVTGNHHTWGAAQQGTMYPSATAAIILDFVLVRAFLDDCQRSIGREFGNDFGSHGIWRRAYLRA